jgi:hypothetical protein
MLRIVLGLLVGVALMIAIPILLAWSGSRRRLRVPEEGGIHLLRMPRGHWALLAVVALLPFAAISGLALLSDWSPGYQGSRWVLGGVMGLAGLLWGGYLAALEVRGGLRLDEQGIVKVGALGRHHLAWSDVSRLTFNPVHNWFFLTGPDRRLIYFAEGLDGIATFAELALAHLPRPVLEASPEAAEALRELAGS